MEIKARKEPMPHVALDLEINGLPPISMAFKSPEGLAEFMEDLCSAAERVWPRPPEAEAIELLNGDGLEVQTEEWIDLGECCACGKTGISVRNIVSMPAEAPVPGTGWGCVVCDLPTNGALAVICDECHEMMRPILRVCVGSPGNNSRVDYDEKLPAFGHDHTKH